MIGNCQACDREMRQPHKVMTPEEYAVMPLQGWHEVCRDVDGFGGVGVRYLGGNGEAMPADETDLDFKNRVTAHLPEWQRRQYLSHTPEQAAIEIARERKTMEDGKSYTSLTTAERCQLQPDGFINDYD